MCGERMTRNVTMCMDLLIFNILLLESWNPLWSQNNDISVTLFYCSKNVIALVNKQRRNLINTETSCRACAVL
jgi:hypothetical protein